MSKEMLGQAIRDLCGHRDVPMLQMTFDGKLVPTAPHPDDRMECSDDTYIRRGDAFVDCNGNAHRNEEDCLEADTDYVTELLDGIAESAWDYSEHADYGDRYSFMVKETHSDWKGRVKDWIVDSGGQFDWEECPELLAWVTETVWQKLYDFDNWDAIHEHGDFCAYFGEGCCLASWEVGECEEQISLAEHPGLAKLHGKGELESILDGYNGELSISHNNCYNEHGRLVTDGYVSKGAYPDIMGYVSPGGQWYFVVDGDNMHDAIEEALTEYAEWEGN